MIMHKCPHSVYIPSDFQGEQSPYCSYCTPTNKGIKPPRNIGEADADELKAFNVCPLCCSREFEYDDENHYRCPVCGFDQNDIV